MAPHSAPRTQQPEVGRTSREDDRALPLATPWQLWLPPARDPWPLPAPTNVISHQHNQREQIPSYVVSLRTPRKL
eukprot:883607-Prymnesium_polylepis.2